MKKKASIRRVNVSRIKLKAPKKSKQLPVSFYALDKVRAELKSDITKVSLSVKSLDKKMEIRFGKIESKISGIDAKFSGIDAKFSSIDAKFAKIDERFTSIDAKFAKIDERFAKIDERFAQIDARFAKIDERFAQIDARFAKIDERFAQIDARFVQIDERFAQIDARFVQIDERFAQIDKRFDAMEIEANRRHQEVMSSFHRILAVVEEQNVRTQSALDGYAHLYEAHHRTEKRLDKIENDISDMAKLLRPKQL